MKFTTKFLARTAVLLGLTVLFQSLRQIVPMPPSIAIYIVGSLVNLSLIIAAIFAGWEGGTIISIIAPLIAFLQGHIRGDMPFLAVAIAIGNISIVVTVYLLYKKNKFLAIGAGALVKFIVLYLSIIRLVLPVIYPNIPDQIKAVLSVNYSWIQLVTALIGGILALLVVPVLDKALDGPKE
ncbi:MAG: ECF transporter S component [Clostridiales bacterium]|nr:ECF transporter S component [Clostridiales bacterium]